MDRDKFFSAAAGAFVGASLTKSDQNQTPSHPPRHGSAAAWTMVVCAILSFVSFFSGSFWGFVFFGVGLFVFPLVVMMVLDFLDAKISQQGREERKAIIEKLKRVRTQGKNNLHDYQIQSLANKLQRDSGYADTIAVAFVDTYEWVGSRSAALAARIRVHAPINRVILVVAVLLGIGVVASPLAYLLFLLLFVGGFIGVTIRMTQRRPIAPWLVAWLSSVPMLVLHLALVALLGGF